MSSPAGCDKDEEAFPARHFVEAYARVRTREAQLAFWRFVADPLLRQRFEVRALGDGAKKAVNFWRDDEYQLAFIANRAHLLWYFRRPFLDRYAINVEAAAKVCGAAGSNPKREITFRIENEAQAAAICRLLQLTIR